MSESQSSQSSSPSLAFLDFDCEPVSQSNMPLLVKKLNLETGTEVTNDGELLVYSRWPKSTNGKDPIPKAPRESELDIAPSVHESSTNLPNPENPSNSVVPDLDLPIALRKKPRSCTLHPILNFVSNSALSASFHSFTNSLDSTKIPNTISEALQSPKWK